MNKIVALWAVPRSTSTAFEWMMRQRGDLDCLHEPFGEAWYQGKPPFGHGFQKGRRRPRVSPWIVFGKIYSPAHNRAQCFSKTFLITSVTCGLQNSWVNSHMLF